MREKQPKFSHSDSLPPLSPQAPPLGSHFAPSSTPCESHFDHSWLTCRIAAPPAAAAACRCPATCLAETPRLPGRPSERGAAWRPPVRIADDVANRRPCRAKLSGALFTLSWVLALSANILVLCGLAALQNTCHTGNEVPPTNGFPVQCSKAYRFEWWVSNGARGSRAG